MTVLNVSAYRFVPVEDAEALRVSLLAAAEARQLKGTVLIAPEGINLFLAGAAQEVRGWLDDLRRDSRFAGLQAKESWSEQVPFKRLKVKVKAEIIRMNRPTVRPAEGRAPALPATTLVQWLERGTCDDGRPVVMLDTRNDFEVEAGKFSGALDWRMSRFSEFPEAWDAHASELADKTVVSYCTGGIRCEKAALWMQQAGHRHVWQLEGGILKYLEETADESGVAPHWNGRCFVFDERTALEADLSAAGEATNGAQS